MKLLITGGLGFMGSNFIRYILRTYPEYSVVNLDKMTYAGNPENVKDVENDSRYTFIKGDIADATVVGKATDGVDAIVNFAAATHVDRSIMDPTAFLQTAILGTYTLLEAVQTKKIQRYIQISTDEVYGAIEEGETDEHAPFHPRSPYSAGKAGGDHLCHAYFETYRTPIMVTHSANCYGPYQYPEKFISLFITNLLEGKKVPVYGDGMQIREWVYVDDHSRAIDVVLHKGKEGEAYNIGTRDRFHNIDIVKKMLSCMGQGEEMIDFVNDRPGHDRRYAPNSDKIRNELGWAPMTSFDDGLQKTIEWYQENRSWWERIKSGEFQEYYKKQYNSSLSS